MNLTERTTEGFRDYNQLRETAALGMWVFLSSEVLFFGGGIFAYLLMRAYYPQAFLEGSHHLDIALGAINTVVLLASSAAVAVAETAFEDKRGQRVGRCLLFAAMSGVIFLLIKGYEYWTKFEHGLIPGSSFAGETFSQPLQTQMFFWIYFALTGLHALHVLIGICWMLGFAAIARMSAVDFSSMQTLALYWHFVDIVWIFLFPLLYLIA